MPDLRLRKLQVTVVCDEYNDDGEPIAERAVAQFDAFPSHLDEIGKLAAQAVEQVKAQAEQQEPTPNRAQRRATAKKKPAAKKP